MNDIQETCQKNAAAALAVGRRDLAKVSQFPSAGEEVLRSYQKVQIKAAPNWEQIKMLKNLDHYSQMSDVQTLAMLCSVFRDQAPSLDGYALFGHHSSRLHSRYPSYTSSSVNSGSCSSTSDSITVSTWNTDPEHPNPWGESSPDDYRYGNQSYTDPRERERELHDMNKRFQMFNNDWFQLEKDQLKSYKLILHTYDQPCCTTRTKQAEESRLLLICHFLYLPRLLDPANTLQFDDFKKCYGEILYRWGLRDKRANVLKFTSSPPEPHKGIGTKSQLLLLNLLSFPVDLNPLCLFLSAEFGVYCCHCRSQARGTQCAVCKRLTFQCAICHVAVRGLSNFCLSCGHGGHTSHMMDWFRRQDECPAGCGCHCLLQSTF
ncbi:hypothetical protein GOODEAATRI_002408 [Goodea atripinnis]|uniref:WDR59/RTC1-like RING zinc finger domain-containing protein n=1 Tax=Goodea atripinnis TaxID=208336 RepID=A0ABV0NGW7_9TELE